MYLVNIHDFGHLNEQTPLMLTDGTSLEHSPQSVLLHHISEKSQNYQNVFLMQSTSLGIIYPHLKSGEELKIKFISVAKQETKLSIVVNLTKDEISTRRAWGVWVCLTEMDKVKYSFKIY
ncbi:hypothetical protein ACS0TY_024226 [Phlomoides rotata]